MPLPGYNIQSLFRVLPQHTVALRCAKALELPQNGFLRGNQDLLYVARNDGGAGRITVAALKATVDNTKPRGLAFSPSDSVLEGKSIGEALWAVVDGGSRDNDRILKIDIDDGTLTTSFAAPSANIQGITFLDGFLWLVGNEPNFDTRLYKVRATTGVLAQTFFISDPAGGISNDGTNLLIFPSNFKDLLIVDQNGTEIERRFAFGNPSIQGARGIAFRSAENQLIVANGRNLDQVDIAGNSFDFLRTFVVAALADIRGSTFRDDDILYLADGGQIFTTAVPSAVTNSPRGLAYDANADELYILVDGAGDAPDHVIVVPDPANAPANATSTRDFDVPGNPEEARTAESITILNGQLYIGLQSPDIIRIDSNDGTELQRLFDGPDFARITGLSNDGQSLVAMQENICCEANFIDPGSGFEFEEQRVFFFDPLRPNFFFSPSDALAINTSTGDFFTLNGAEVRRFDERGSWRSRPQRPWATSEVLSSWATGCSWPRASATPSTPPVSLCLP